MERLKKCLRLPDDIPAGGYTHDGTVGGFIPYGKHESDDYEYEGLHHGFMPYDLDADVYDSDETYDSDERY